MFDSKDSELISQNSSSPPTESTKQVDFISGATDVLVIAPHGVMGDDDRTDTVALCIAQELECSAMINSSYNRSERNYNDRSEAEQDNDFINKLRTVLDGEGHTLVLWIHGFSNDEQTNLETQLGLDQNETVDCLIGIGQPDETRYTANPATIDRLISVLKDQGISAYLSPVDGTPGSNYCARDLNNMNQWCRQQSEYSDHSKVESIQLEFKKPGFRDSDEHAKDLGIKVAHAINKMVEDQRIVNTAFDHLKSIFRTHFHNAMVQAGQYIINTFYASDPRAALAKNKTKDQPPNLKALIEKIKKQPKARDDGTPSIGWFYNAVNLAAHEAICEQMGLQTFGILGHSHKLQLLHVPKLKSVTTENFDAAIQTAFQQKEQLAQDADNNKWSVRELKKHIEQQYPSDRIDFTTPPPIADLRTRTSKELVQVYNSVQKKVETSHEQIRNCQKTLDRLGKVIAEKGDEPLEGKGRFRDWTEPANNFNICRGCSNDCLYCYAKPGINFRCKVAPGSWHQMTILDERVNQTQNLKSGIVGFPSTHDIFPGAVLEAYLTVLGKFLRAGNEVLIVTKPRLDCIKEICSASRFFKDKILFRFTIGAMDDGILQFWEPNAPLYQERKESLKYAHEHGFRTSVSMEPMLDTPNIEALVNDVLPFITEDIWLGTMNHLDEMKKGAGTNLQLKNEIIKLEHNQLPPVLNKIKNTFESNPRIKWKSDALKEMKKSGGKVKIPWEKAIITDADGVQKEVDAPYVISATRRSDIPNHFSNDFMNALRQGHISFIHGDNDTTVSFDKTRFIVFWTKNPEPLLKHLDEIDQMGIGYYFNYTLNDYDALKLEPNLPPLENRIETFRSLSSKIGKERVVWRFDPLILADKISRQDLIDKVGAIMKDVAGYTEKLVISFLDPKKYGAKTKLKKAGINIQEFSDEDKLFICNSIVQMANQHNIQLATCAEGSTALQADFRIIPNKCVDDNMMRSISTDAQILSFLDKISGLKDAGQRDLCCCAPSYDVGSYGTCKSGCLYCYALRKNKNWRKGYLYVSVIQKAVRRCEINLARYYAQQMLELGNPGWLWKRLLIISSEDIGLADPTMVGYVRERYDAFENLRKQKNVEMSDVKEDSQLCDIIDQVVIAEAISNKSRELPMLSFITLYEIFKNENFKKDVSEYLNCFVDALDRKDEREAVYYATIVDTFMGHGDPVLSLIEERSKNHNAILISQWIKEYDRKDPRLPLNVSWKYRIVMP